MTLQPTVRQRQPRFAGRPATSRPASSGCGRCSTSFNGDLCYANLADDRVRTWSDFWENNSRSARYRPWMPAAGNHENELGNGPIGYRRVPDLFRAAGSRVQTDVTRGLWYAFTVGSVRVISLPTTTSPTRTAATPTSAATPGARRRRWLEKELTATRANRDIDWIVVCMHQVVGQHAPTSSTAPTSASAQEWVPLFDKYGVDLVVCGHEHHYERSHPIRGQQPNHTLTPIPTATATDVVDTSKGTVHMVIGGGGTSAAPTAALQPAGLPRDHLRRRARPDHRQAAAGLRQGGRALVGRPQRGAPLRLRGLHRRPGHAGRPHHDARSPTTTSPAPTARPFRWTSSRSPAPCVDETACSGGSVRRG